MKLSKFKRMLPYLFVIALAFYLLPAFGKDTGSFMVILLIAIPLVCFVAALLQGARWGFNVIFSIIVMTLFIPTIFIYYNSSAWIYAIIYALVALIGSALGGFGLHKIK